MFHQRKLASKFRKLPSNFKKLLFGKRSSRQKDSIEELDCCGVTEESTHYNVAEESDCYDIAEEPNVAEESNIAEESDIVEESDRCDVVEESNLCDAAKESDCSDTAVFNKHVCEVCSPAMDYLRGVPLSLSENFHIEIKPTPENPFLSARFQYRHNTRTLQQSIEGGCSICRAIWDCLLRAGMSVRSPEHCRLYGFNFWNNSAGSDKTSCDIDNFTCLLAQTQVRFEGMVHILTNERKDDFTSEIADHCNPRERIFGLDPFCVIRTAKDFESSRAFGFPLHISPDTNHSSNILLQYQPVADMLSNPLWELITQWIARCCSNHWCSHNNTTSMFPKRLVELSTTDSGLEARLVETTGDAFIPGYDLSPSAIQYLLNSVL